MGTNRGGKEVIRDVFGSVYSEEEGQEELQAAPQVTQVKTKPMGLINGCAFCESPLSAPET